MEDQLADKGKVSSSDQQRTWRLRWWAAAALVVLAAGSLTVYFLAGRLLPRNLPSPQDVVYGEPMWAMHASMHGAASGMMGISPVAPAGNSQAPIAAMEERFYDFGTLNSPKEVNHDFVLANQGDAPLLITRAYTTCGCTSAEISAAVIPPGKAGLVTVYFNPQLAAAGSTAVRRGIILETNDPHQPQIEIWVQASLNH